MDKTLKIQFSAIYKNQKNSKLYYGECALNPNYAIEKQNI